MINKFRLFILFLIIFIQYNCFLNTNIIEGAWILTDKSYRPIQDKIYFDSKMIIIKENVIYFGYINDLYQFFWEKSSHDDFKIKALKNDSFTIKYNKNLEEKYLYRFMTGKKVECQLITNNKSPTVKEDFYGYLKKVSDYNLMNKIKIINPTIDKYDKLSLNNSASNATLLTFDEFDLNQTFHDEIDVDWFTFNSVKDYIYRFVASDYSPNRNIKRTTAVNIDICKYNMETKKIEKIGNGKDGDKPGFKNLYWRSLKNEKMYIKIYNDNNDKIGSYKVTIIAENHSGDDVGTFKKIIPINKKK